MTWCNILVIYIYFNATDQMEAKNVFDGFLNDLKETFPTITVSEYSIDEEVKNLERTWYPSLMKILQRDDTFFTSEDRLFCGVNVSQLWRAGESSHEAIWKHVQMCMFASFFHGDIKDKIGTVVSTLKSMWNASGQENDEISNILNDEEAESHFTEIFEYLQGTRLAKIFTELVEEIDPDEFMGDLNFENPQEIIDMFRNPENPTMKNIVTKIQKRLQQKMERGDFTQNQIMAEVEGIKAKLQSMFGNVVNEMLGGRRADIPASVLMGNSPEARRQRMLARLQKKQREKNSR